MEEVERGEVGETGGVEGGLDGRSVSVEGWLII